MVRNEDGFIYHIIHDSEVPLHVTQYVQGFGVPGLAENVVNAVRLCLQSGENVSRTRR